jgi:uncharacterized membrane protein YoaT (DUF817 family)
MRTGPSVALLLSFHGFMYACVCVCVCVHIRSVNVVYDIVEHPRFVRMLTYA